MTGTRSGGRWPRWLMGASLLCALVMPIHAGGLRASVVQHDVSGAGTVTDTGTGAASKPAGYELQIAVVGAGKIVSTPAGIDCGNRCRASFSAGANVTLKATAFPGYVFKSWSGSGSNCGTAAQCTVKMSAAKQLTATFTASNRPLLKVSVTGSGKVTSAPAGINCGSDCSERYTAGTTVTLTAAPASGQQFTGWAGAGSSCGRASTCSVKMDGARTVSASFSTTPQQWPLSVSVNGNGSVSSAPAGIQCGSDCSENYLSGTTVNLSAVAASGYRFSGWSGSNISCGAAITCSVLMNAARNVSASFVAETAPVLLTVIVSGSGSVSSAPAGITCGSDCSESFASGSSITLTATAAGGFRFTGWTGEGVNCPGTGTCVVTLTAARTVTAAFVAHSGGTITHVSVSGMGRVQSADQAISCGSVPASETGTGSACAARLPAGNVSFTATPYSSQFRFLRWRGACTGTSPTCTLDVSNGQEFGAVFVPVSGGTDICAAQNLKSDKLVYKLDGHFPALAVGQSFTDPKFGTTIRRVTDVKNDGRGSHNVIKTLYSTVSAWNADESMLILYRTDGGSPTHELYHGKTYQFIRKLDDIAPVDLEQVYWDTRDPDILYYANRSYNNLYRYRVSTRTKEVIRNFDTECGSLELHGGGDPLFNSWDSRKFGFACAPNGNIFSYDQGSNSVGRLFDHNLDYGAPQAAPSGTRFFVNENSAYTSNRPATVRDANMNVLRTLDLASGNEHGALSLLANGDDTWNAVAFDDGPAGSGTGTLVQHNLATGASRVIVGQVNGYPYPPSGTHVGATAFHRTGLVAVSVKDDRRGDSLLDTELLFVDTDTETNPASSVCRVGHHRSISDDYWAEPHPSISPSGTRILFSSSWGDARSGGEVVNVYVLELPGYRP